MAQGNAVSRDEQEYPCILKVTDGGKANFSTKVCSGFRHPSHATN